MAPLLHPSTSPIFTPVLFSSQNLGLFNSSRDEKRTPLNRGNSALLSLVPFGGILPLKPRRTPKSGTFIWHCKPHGGSEVQLLDLVETNNDGFPLVEKEHVIREKMEGSLVEGCNYETPTTGKNYDFVERDGELGMIGSGGSTKNAMDSSTNSNTKNLNSDSGMGPGSLSVVDYIKRIASLPIEERVRFLDLLQCDNQSLTISDYNDILEALLRAEEFEHVIKLFSKLEPNGIKPDIRSFCILINCFCKKNNPFEAKRALDEMLQKGFIPNVVTFTSVVCSLCKRGRVTIAMDVLDKMRKASVEPTIQTYNNLIVGLCYVGRLEEVSELVDNLKNSPTKPDIYTYTLVIDSFCKVGKVDEAIELFNEAKEKGLKPSIYTYNALLNGFCKKSRTFEAVSLLKEMEAQGIKPDGICYNVVLRGHLVNREYSLAWEMFKRTRETGFPLGMRSTNAVLRGLCRLCLTNKEILKDVKELFEIIVGLQFGPTPYTYSLMIQALASAGEIDSALLHLNNMVNTGACPRMLSFNMVIRLLCREGRVYDAQSVLVTMIKLGKLPGTFSFEIILNESSSQGKFSDALALYAVALKLGINPKWRFKYQLSCRNDSK